MLVYEAANPLPPAGASFRDSGTSPCGTMQAERCGTVRDEVKADIHNAFARCFGRDAWSHPHPPALDQKLNFHPSNPCASPLADADHVL
jgi:hypothetical protein